ncbi:MAG: tetratricopeptide repeat protein [Gammaproteobacteria bacterium]
MKRLAAGALLLLAGHAFAQNEPAAPAGAAEAARAAMQAGNYAEAYCLWRALAEAGDADAQYNLGWMYHNGYGLVIDDAQAQRWWENAAGRGSTDALAALGNLLRYGGRGVPPDPSRAVDWFVRAAGSGDDESALFLRTLIAKNDASVRARRVELLTQHGAALGAAIVVRSEQTGFRQKPDPGTRLLAVFPKGKALVELSRWKGWVQAGDPADGRVGWLRATLVEAAD